MTYSRQHLCCPSVPSFYYGKPTRTIEGVIKPPYPMNPAPPMALEDQVCLSHRFCLHNLQGL